MGGNETMTKRFTIDENGKYFDKKEMRYVTVDYLMDLVNRQDQKIKELEKAIHKLIIELFKPQCSNNNDKYEVLNKFLNEEVNIKCIEVDIDIEK